MATELPQISNFTWIGDQTVATGIDYRICTDNTGNTYNLKTLDLANSIPTTYNPRRFWRVRK